MPKVGFPNGLADSTGYTIYTEGPIRQGAKKDIGQVPGTVFAELKTRADGKKEIVISGEGKIKQLQDKLGYYNSKHYKEKLFGLTGGITVDAIRIEESSNASRKNKIQFPDDASGLFSDLKNEVIIPDNMDTSNVTSMKDMFSNTEKVNPNVANWDTSKVTNMYAMFEGAKDANPDTSKWDTSSVTNMSSMFLEAINANPDTSNWDVSKVRYMNAMFRGAVNANPDTSKWKTSSLEKIQAMFLKAIKANPDVSKWDTSKVYDMSAAFAYAVSANPDIRNWNLSSLNNAFEMFYDANNATIAPENFKKFLSVLNDYGELFYEIPEGTTLDFNGVNEFNFDIFKEFLKNRDIATYDENCNTRECWVRFKEEVIKDRIPDPEKLLPKAKLVGLDKPEIYTKLYDHNNNFLLLNYLLINNYENLRGKQKNLNKIIYKNFNGKSLIDRNTGELVRDGDPLFANLTYKKIFSNKEEFDSYIEKLAEMNKKMEKFNRYKTEMDDVERDKLYKDDAKKAELTLLRGELDKEIEEIGTDIKYDLSEDYSL